MPRSGYRTPPGLKRYVGYNRVRCAVCERCYQHPWSPVCIYGGPYVGYVEEKDITNDCQQDPVSD